MKKVIRMLFTLSVLLLITSCGFKTPEKNNNINVMFLSEIPKAYEESIVNLISTPAIDEANLDLNLVLYPASHEKLTIEIVAKQTDIFVVDYSLRHILLDPYGLTPLDQFNELLPNNSLVEEFTLEDDASGQVHLYALPITNDSKFLEDLGLVVPSPMLAVIVSHSDHPEIALEILEKLL
ncbi:hypothetical protein DS745_08285 [Anaerobacillus alkaliphilus]|uniref:Uncharacterized protein n=1 Tax=Anaerobacillus alkaliphilus TaxID=1548597 RepID=A0A4Q0VWW9_9BACI|nr:hypothetical protein [Anaerobacillus alkaliphilus]RXJ02078.1 hypothetical protein DS745_08285 [Anaerobacillus alkaliphilus]